MGKTTTPNLLDFGCAVAHWHDALFSRPLDTSGEQVDEWGEVTAPESQAFLDAANAALGTSFTFDQFAGR